MLYKGLVVIITASVSESNTFCKRLRISATSLPDCNRNPNNSEITSQLEPLVQILNLICTSEILGGGLKNHPVSWGNTTASVKRRPGHHHGERGEAKWAFPIVARRSRRVFEGAGARTATTQKRPVQGRELPHWKMCSNLNTPWKLRWWQRLAGSDLSPGKLGQTERRWKMEDLKKRRVFEFGKSNKCYMNANLRKKATYSARYAAALPWCTSGPPDRPF